MLERATTSTDLRLLPALGPAAARAAISPTALVLAGAGAGAGLVVGLPVLVAVAIGAGLWGIRVGIGATLAASQRSKAQRPETIDPYAVPDPWRSFVRESLTAQAKFDQAVARSHPGPLQDRLGDISRRIHEGVRECWRVAHLGAALDGTVGALDPEATSRQLRRFQQSTLSARPGSAALSHSPSEETEAALAAQLQAARRVQAAGRRTTDRLRVLTAELNAAVAGAVELSLDAGEATAAIGLASHVDTVVGEIESLRRALEEANSARTGRLPA